ncbi:location of vulva defective 1-like [Stylophora pistillata]|uniref:Polycystic kidney disease protein 1-like 2 n=1 Tax=Stylophora pistillata TaxID=50429 RepID=A0A2B4R5S3_STYPI|nr:location of vulva defective 1-like [Stylophora pistillata]PFX12506.1 Polycystic kidney disease protein 1-like 2 [Stylophora pistillata]
MSWILADPTLNNSDAILNGTVVSAEKDKWTLTDHHLQYAHMVHALFLSLTILQGSDNLTYSVFDKGYIIIRPSPLVARISGETEITRGNKQIITLNGSQSYDPHVGHGARETLKFFWLCKRSDEILPNENPNDIQIAPILLNHSGESQGGCFGTGIGRLEFKEPIITLNASVIDNTSETYVFKLIVTKDARWSSDSKKVHVIEGSPPEVSFLFVLGDRLCVNPSAPLTISAEYPGYSCDSQVQFEWILYQEDRNLTWTQISSTPQRSNVFSVGPNSLKDNMKYRLQLTVTPKDEASSKTVQIFRTAVLPWNGSCVITPETGEAVYTSFQLHCFEWFPLDELITYDVQVIGEGNIHHTLYHGLNARQQLVLPQGNYSSGYESKVKVFVSRSNGATSEVDITIKVTPPQPRVQQDLFELLGKSPTFFEQFIFEEDTHKAWQLMAAILLTLEKQELVATRGFSNSAAPSQMKSALRDIVLKRFQFTEIDLSSIVSMSAFLASAGKNVTELSPLAKDVLLDALENISSLLLSKAKNMNAEEERFIFQGVSNLLFGTVELMMASADAAAFSVNSQTLSPEQLKAKDTVLKSMDITRTLLTTMAVRLAVSQSPKRMQVPGMNILVGRESPCGLQERTLSVSRNEGFRLPQNMNSAFANHRVEWAEYQMIKTSFNPYRWHESYREIKSEVLSLEFTSDTGALPVGGGDVDIDIKIPLNPPGNSSYDNNYFLRPQIMRYHTIELADNSDSMILEVQPTNESLLMVVYVKLGERPTVSSYSHISTVPDYSSCSWDNVNGRWKSRCSRSPYQVMSTEHFNQTGLYYVGILYVESTHDQLNRTRTRRSCLGKKREKRDCVEPKPPPVSGINYNRTLIYNPFTDQNYTITVRKYRCYYFALTQDQWSKEGCKVGDVTDDQLLHCRCNHLTGFGGGFVVAPIPIDIDKVLTEFTRLEETENYVVLATVCSIFGVYALVMIWARKADLKDERKLGPTVHVKPTENGTYKYEFTVVTGVWRNPSTTANVFVKIFGTDGILESVNLTASAPPGRRLFARGNIDKFVFHLEHSLGIVVKIELWHDNSGKNSSWFLDQVRLTDMETIQKWDFFHHNWLALHKGTGSLKATIKSADPGNEGRSFKTLFHTVFLGYLAEHHLWASVITRPPRNQFTRVQRTSCCLCLLYLAMVCNAVFYHVTRVPYESIQIGPLQMSLRQLVIGIQSSLIIAPLSLIITALFRYRKMERPKQRVVYETGENSNVDPIEKTGLRWCLLPHSFLFLAWLLCLSATFVSATITVFYSLQWGKQTADRWLASVVVSSVQDVFVWQPTKVIIFALLLILIFDRPKRSCKTGDRNKPPLNKGMKERQAFELRKEKFFGLVRHFVMFLVFYLLLMIVAYGDKDHHRYLMTRGTWDGFTFFYKVNTGEKMWTYMLGKFIHDSYAGEWYNGQVEHTPEYIGNKVSMLIGMPRLRQLRIKEDSCQVAEGVETIIDKCYDFYSAPEEDKTRLYLPHWNHLSDSQTKWNNLSQLCPRPWRYSTEEELNNFPSWAQHHIYGGGGYVLDLGYDKATAIRMMEGVKDKDWIDRRTRAILLEFQVLNLNTNFMSIITYHYEVLPFGFGLTYEKITTMKLFSFQSMSYNFYLLCQLLFMLAVLLHTSILLVRLCRMGRAFFKQMWNWIDIAQFASASLAIVFYVLKVKFMYDSVKKLLRNPFVTVSFQYAIFWTEMENTALAFALFIATFKILHFIRLSPHVQILAWTMMTAKNDILSFSVLFGILFIAHGHFAFLVFGKSVYSFSSFFRSFASEFELALGNTIHVSELDDVNRVLGNLFTASFMLALAVLLINIFVSILDFNLHNVKEDEERLREAFGMGEFVKSLLFGKDNDKQN